MPDAVSIRILTDEGLKTYRRRALEVYLNPTGRQQQIRASQQMLAAQDEHRRRLAP